MDKHKYRYFVGDFETTVYDGQLFTEVWASACVEMYTEDVHIFNSIVKQFDYFVNLNENICCFYHNLKFDGSFWLSYLLKDLGFTQAYKVLNDEGTSVKWLPDKEMPNNSVIYSISEMGQWYFIKIKKNNKIIEFRDSLKLLPFSVKRIGESFKTKHKKLDIEYKGIRHAGGLITDEEKAYISNDVLVVKEALEIMFNEGHSKLTIGSCCLAEYRKTIDRKEYERFFPNIYDIELNKDEYGVENAGEYIRRSYKGGWCYLVPHKANKIIKRGCTADVNSLYPSMMSSESGNAYPVGNPTFWKGNEIPLEALAPNTYFFIRIKTRFYLKKNKLPFIQIKHSLIYKSNECLSTSDYYNKATGKYVTHWVDVDGNIRDTRVTMTLTMIDYKLFIEHYDVAEFEILDGCYFKSAVGIFDEYIEKYKKIKLESKGAKRELAKLFLNNLYGKMASNTDSSFKIARVKDDGVLGYLLIHENGKKPGYIPVGSAITSYARNFTIRAAQKNYHGVGKRGFIYADTDSIHCDLKPNEVKGITVHDKNFCCWKLEATWDEAIFVRQKTYIEHIIEQDLNPVDEPFYNVKCAGMPERSKMLFMQSLQGYKPKETDEYTEEELFFLSEKRELTDFKYGLIVPGNLKAKTILGGTLLVDNYYKMREGGFI